MDRLHKHGQGIRLRAADRLPLLLVDSLGVFPDLFVRLEVKVIGPVFVVLTVVGRVVATNLRASFIRATTVVLLEHLAGRVDEQVPVFVLFEEGGVVVEYDPTDILHILEFGRRFIWHGDILTTLGRTVFAKIAPFGEIFSANSLGSVCLSCCHRGTPSEVMGWPNLTWLLVLGEPLSNDAIFISRQIHNDSASKTDSKLKTGVFDRGLTGVFELGGYILPVHDERSTARGVAFFPIHELLEASVIDVR